MAEPGFLAMLVPEEYGGSAATFTEYCLAVEEFAAADAGYYRDARVTRIYEGTSHIQKVIISRNLAA